jgi:hypothetical protein
MAIMDINFKFKIFLISDVSESNETDASLTLEEANILNRIFNDDNCGLNHWSSSKWYIGMSLPIFSEPNQKFPGMISILNAIIEELGHPVSTVRNPILEQACKTYGITID